MTSSGCVGCFLSAGALALAACATTSAATGDGNGRTGVHANASSSTSGGDVAGSPADAVGDCAPRRAHRMFVGFADDMSLDDFELAALEAERITRTLSGFSCVRAAELETSGALVAGLRAGTLEVFEIRFLRADATLAEIGLRSLAADDSASAPSPGYRLVLTQAAGEWMLTAARAEAGAPAAP